MGIILVYILLPGSLLLSSFCHLPCMHDLRKIASNLVFLFEEQSFLLFEGRTKQHWINYSLIQASLNQSSVHQVTLSGEGIIPSCSKLLLSTAVVHTVVCKGVNIFIMFVKFILYTCRSRLLFCDIWGGVRF